MSAEEESLGSPKPSNSIEDHVQRSSFSCFSNSFGERFGVWLDTENSCGWFVTDAPEDDAIQIVDGFLLSDLLLRDSENGFLACWWAEHTDTDWQYESLNGLYERNITNIGRKLRAHDEFEEDEKAVLSYLMNWRSETNTPDWLFVKDGNSYRIRGFGEEGHISHSNGCEYFQKLIDSPMRPIDVFELQGMNEEEIRIQFSDFSQQKVHDDIALTELHNTRRELEDRIEAANDTGNDTLAEELEQELQQLRTAAVLNKEGQSDIFAGFVKKSQNRISASRSRLIKKMKAAQMPKLASHFEHSISAAGANFIYQPIETAPNWIIS